MCSSDLTSEPRTEEPKTEKPKDKKTTPEPKAKKTTPEPKAKKTKAKKSEEEEVDAEQAGLEAADQAYYSSEEEETPTVQEPSKKELKAAEKAFKDKTQVPKEIEKKIKDVVASKKAKLKAALENNDEKEYEKDLTALKQWLNGKEISKYINILGDKTYDINTILKDIQQDIQKDTK